MHERKREGGREGGGSGVARPREAERPISFHVQGNGDRVAGGGNPYQLVLVEPPVPPVVPGQKCPCFGLKVGCVVVIQGYGDQRGVDLG